MDKNQPFFDPYNFNMQPLNPMMQNQMNMGMQDMPSGEIPTGAISPNMYYEQQCTYYRYLNEMLDYKIKLKEWEKLNKDENKK